jgi:ribosomal protein S18 acetylase RimI-like enzyme
MSIACVDWRHADPERVAALYRAEIGRWATLGWDTAASWRTIEAGRRLGTLPGLLAIGSSGAIVGWTFYLLHGATLQIGGLLAASASATDLLLDGVLSGALASRAQAITVFAFADAPGLAGALASRNLAVDRYAYLVKPLDAPPRGACSGLRAWRGTDAEATATLLSRAYPGAEAARPFAPRGAMAEWREYVGQLTQAAGCGTLMADSSVAVPDGPDRLAGLVLVTRLSASTAHIAQIAVDPGARRRGLGRLLVDEACDRARRAGCDRITLLVGQGNSRARRLYETSGFVETASFVSAGRVQPLRSTSVAAGGNAITRP